MKPIDINSLEREMTNRANARAAHQGPDVTLWRKPGMVRSHFFLGSRQVSLCGRVRLADNLIDPRAMMERTVAYCPACWRRFCGVK